MKHRSIRVSSQSVPGCGQINGQGAGYVHLTGKSIPLTEGFASQSVLFCRRWRKHRSFRSIHPQSTRRTFSGGTEEIDGQIGTDESHEEVFPIRKIDLPLLVPLKDGHSVRFPVCLFHSDSSPVSLVKPSANYLLRLTPMMKENPIEMTMAISPIARLSLAISSSIL